MIVVALVVTAFAALPAVMVLLNLLEFTTPPRVIAAQDGGKPVRVSILIPARDEAASIAECLNAALSSRNVDVEVVVLDDASQDATPDIVLAVAGRDSRVRLIKGKPLPEGWNGKQFACYQLAKAAQYQQLLFIDADVRLTTDALERLVAAKADSGAALLSAFPHQETETFWERLLIPLMHFILLGFLPFARMRSSNNPAYAAGCGQLFLTARDDYERAGTHEAIKGSRHDGVTLPRAYRNAGMMTDVVDGDQLATCRMYSTASAVWRGLLKNADEGIAKPSLIVPFSVLLVGGGVLPFVWFPISAISSNIVITFVLAIGVAAAWFPRWACALRFNQSKIGALLHPLSLSVFIFIQWYALFATITGKRVAWRGRTT